MLKERHIDWKRFGENRKKKLRYYRFKYVQCTCTKLRARDCFRAFKENNRRKNIREVREKDSK